MAEELLEGATPERCVRAEWRSCLRTQLTAPDHSPTDSGLTPLRSILIPWEQFGTLLQQRLEHRGGRCVGVCSQLSSNQTLPFYHMPAVII